MEEMVEVVQKKLRHGWGCFFNDRDGVVNSNRDTPNADRG